MYRTATIDVRHSKDFSIVVSWICQVTRKNHNQETSYAYDKMRVFSRTIGFQTKVASKPEMRWPQSQGAFRRAHPRGWGAYQGRARHLVPNAGKGLMGFRSSMEPGRTGSQHFHELHRKDHPEIGHRLHDSAEIVIHGYRYCLTGRVVLESRNDPGYPRTICFILPTEKVR